MPDATTPPSEILVPIDFSDCSIRALNFAKRLANGCQSRLHLLYVDDDPILMQESTDQSYRDEHEDKMSMKFIEMLTSEERERYRTVMAVRCGTASHEIEQYAMEKDIELIVIGNIGRSKLSKALLGSVTSHVVANALCPVTTVKPD